MPRERRDLGRAETGLESERDERKAEVVEPDDLGAFGIEPDVGPVVVFRISQAAGR
jgi:hypothetical protein